MCVIEVSRCRDFFMHVMSLPLPLLPVSVHCNKGKKCPPKDKIIVVK